ncbi:MAG: exonuclease domain-containing protein [Clostridia bacterium]|nr:exonuclease domain-containing protein [Clostridia bacterium]
MHYIILDLEWNQPISWQSPVYRRVGDRLIFEMIQIGAVKMGEDLTIMDSVSIPIAPTHYLKIHPRIRRMTGLGEEELAGAPSFRAAMEEFIAWCGEDYALLTWGCDDVSVLQQNINFFECNDLRLPPVCDIQKLFAQVHGMKDRPSLQKAMELMNIPADERLSFHNARNDAWYTALVFQTVPDPAAALSCVQRPKNLIHKTPQSWKSDAELFSSVREALSCETAAKPICPRCGRNLALDGEYVPQTPDKYIGVGKCKSHGKLLIRLRLRPEEEGKVSLKISTAPANRANVAYVHTKQFQISQMEERPDPDEALRQAARSSVPFEG